MPTNNQPPYPQAYGEDMGSPELTLPEAFAKAAFSNNYVGAKSILEEGGLNPNILRNFALCSDGRVINFMDRAGPEAFKNHIEERLLGNPPQVKMVELLLSHGFIFSAREMENIIAAPEFNDAVKATLSPTDESFKIDVMFDRFNQLQNRLPRGPYKISEWNAQYKIVKNALTRER